MKVSYIAHLSGKVQGVSFRSLSQQMAIDFSLSGYARNLTDGHVEVLVCGEQSNVDKMLLWLQQGPPEAIIDSVEQKQVAWQEHSFFAIN